jgi:hypothetical protein
MESVTIKLDPVTRCELREIRRADGIPINEQIRRAIEAWLGKRSKLPLDARDRTTASR